MEPQPKSPIDATTEKLVVLLEERPVLWVGAGASIAAGYPSTKALITELRKRADDDIPEDLEFTAAVDAFVRSNGQGSLRNLLHTLFRKPHEPTRFHRAMARLAARQTFSAIITTNYDPLIERTLQEAKVPHVVQTIEKNATVGANDLRVLKVHGSYDDWAEVILSGRSYEEFDRRYGFLTQQLDILLQQHPLLFVGCSMVDPRILGWLDALPSSRDNVLQRWRPMMTRADWDAALSTPWNEHSASKPLSRGNIRPLVVRDYGEYLLTLWDEAAQRLAPPEPERHISVPGSGAVQPARPAPRISPWRLPMSGEHFVGRQEELRRLDGAWDDPQIRVLSIVGLGGEGKTTLVNRWFQRLERDGWRGAAAVFSWSFYSQGTRDTATSAEPFLDEALRWFGDPDPAAGPPYERGRRLASLVRKQRTLLILDGVEPLQNPPGVMDDGRINDPGLAALLRELAMSMDGLCLVTTRTPLGDLAGRTHSSAPRLDLERLAPDDGVDLLRQLGVKGTAAELRDATEEMDGHCLALTLLGTYLRKAKHGDVRCHHDLPLLEAADRLRNDKPRRIMAAYDAWLPPTERAVLRIIGLFDRPAEGDAIAALRRPPPIPGLTDSIANLADDEWQIAISNLRETGLVASENPTDPYTLDAHPLVRAYFGAVFHEENADAWRAGHLRLFEHYEKAAPDLPTTLKEMMPLFTAVVHGCLAGRQQAVLEDVYKRRIRRHSDQYSTMRLGAYGATLSALAAFFEHRWNRPASELDPEERGYVLNAAGLCLSALGRTNEALDLVKASLTELRRQAVRDQEAIVLHNLGEIHLLSGHIALATSHVQESIDLAQGARDPIMLVSCQATLANILCGVGQVEESELLLAKAESLSLRIDDRYPFLFSKPGYHYCNVLLEQLSPDIESSAASQIGHAVSKTSLKVRLNDYQRVRQRAARLLPIAQHQSIVEAALYTLILGRAYLGLGVVSRAVGRSKEGTNHLGHATQYMNQAVARLRQAGQDEYLVEGLTRRAILCRILGQREEADADLQEALDLAERGSMRLYECDVHLEWARLHLSAGEHDAARPHVERAKEIIETTGYHRRDRELAELQALLAQ